MTLSRDALATTLPTPFRYYDRIGSTNDAARDWLREGAPVGAVVIADQQIAGRGRHRRRWQTPPGACLAMTVILRPPRLWLPRVIMLAAVSVCEQAEGLGCEGTGIKWPNDIQIAGRKVCGILPEAVWDGDSLRGVVLGMGVNVRVDFRGTELEGAATSLEDELGKRIHRAQLARGLLSRVLHWNRLIDSDALFDAWRSRLNMLGKAVIADGAAGRALDVTSDGSLILQDSAGESNVLQAGDIHFA